MHYQLIFTLKDQLTRWCVHVLCVYVCVRWLLQRVESVWTAGPRRLRCGGGTVRVTICVTPADSITRWTGRIALSSNPSGGWYVSKTFLYWWHFRLSLCFSPIQEEVGLLAAGNWLDKCRSLFSDITIEKLHSFFYAITMLFLFAKIVIESVTNNRPRVYFWRCIASIRDITASAVVCCSVAAGLHSKHTVSSII